MKKPDFICIGAQKAGTTSLQDMLSSHPNVYLSPLKEIKFFHRDEHYSKGIDWYLKHFQNANENQIIGDITPDYMLYGSVAQRILNDLGKNTKIIAILRNPVDRCFSQFNFHLSANVESNPDFQRMIEQYKRIDLENNEFINWYTPPYYIERGLYYNQLKRFFDFFPKENIHIIIFEELYSDSKKEELNKLFRFLNIEDMLDIPNIHNHSTRIPKENYTHKFIRKLKLIKKLIKPVLPEDKYSKLRSNIIKYTTKKPNKLDDNYKKSLFNIHFDEDVKKLEVLLERDLSIWR